jgi:phosphoglycerate dehydrogenase-like enzyme
MSQQEQSKPTVGFIGMGHMGSHMAPRLIHAGYHVTVYDRTREKALSSTHEPASPLFFLEHEPVPASPPAPA